MHEVNLQKKIYIIIMAFSTNKIQLFWFGVYAFLCFACFEICIHLFINNMKN